MIGIKLINTGILFNLPTFKCPHYPTAGYSTAKAHFTLHTNNNRITFRIEKMASDKGNLMNETVRKMRRSQFAYKVNPKGEIDMFRENTPHKMTLIDDKLRYVTSLAIDLQKDKLADMVMRSAHKSTFKKAHNFVLPDEYRSFALDIYIAENPTKGNRTKKKNEFSQVITVNKKRYMINICFSYPAKPKNSKTFAWEKSAPLVTTI